MTKKAFSWVFMLCATLFNIVLLGLLFLVFTVITFLIAGENPTVAMVGIAVSFFLAIALSMFLYSKILNWVIRKWNLEDKMDPIFGRKRR